MLGEYVFYCLPLTISIIVFLLKTTFEGVHFNSQYIDLLPKKKRYSHGKTMWTLAILKLCTNSPICFTPTLVEHLCWRLSRIIMVPDGIRGGL